MERAATRRQHAIAQCRPIAYIGCGTISRQKPPLETPCLNICLLDDEAGLCVGCWRTLDEIARWGSMSEGERRAIMAALPARKERLESVKG